MENNNRSSEIITKSLGGVNSLVMMLITHSANVACGWIFYQPEEPQELKKFRKF